MLLFWISLALICTTVEPKDFDAANWMSDNLDLLGKRTLKHICIPGSHDAGMSQMNGGTAFASECNILTQSLPILDQLELGSRYFDVRPVISQGHFMTGHYTDMLDHWQGGNGQSVESIVNEINLFTSRHNELVILSISTSLNTDLGNTKYREFDREEWERLFTLLDRVNDPFSGGDLYLPGVTLGQFTANGTRPAVVIVVKGDVNLGERLGNGYFYPHNLKLYDRYSNADIFQEMARDQLKKMKEKSQNSYFLLSWTLTQHVQEAATCSVHLGKSIKELAVEAKNNLVDSVYPEVSRTAFPNIIYVDDLTTPNVAKFAMAINEKIIF